MIALKKGLVAQLCPTFCNPMDYSLLDSSVNGILQEEYWSGLPFPSSGDLSDPGIEPVSLTSLALAVGFFITSTTWEAKIAYNSTYLMF